MWKVILAGVALVMGTAPAHSREGVLIRCGASSGYSYFLRDELTNPKDSDWQEDGMRNGQIILVKLGEEWDIQFSDAAGAHGYRSDGADVVPLMATEGYISVGAFHPGYIDIYNFDLTNREVAWTSNKVGTLIKKVAAYRASCD